MFIVSHDRYFINRMADKVIGLKEDGCVEVEGNYDEYVARVKAPETVVAAKPVKENTYKQRKEQESNRRKLTTRIRKLEEAIEQTEQEITDLQATLQEPDVQTDYQRITEISSEIQEK